MKHSVLLSYYDRIMWEKNSNVGWQNRSECKRVWHVGGKIITHSENDRKDLNKHVAVTWKKMKWEPTIV